MKLFLTSAGISNMRIRKAFLSALPKKPAECSVLLIAYIQTKREEKFLDFLKNEMTKIGIEDISFFNLKEKTFSQTKESKKDYDIIYLSGGSTFEMLERIRKTKIDNFIKKYSTKEGKVFFAISAGSIIAGPDIEIAGWGSEADDNTINLKNLTGLKLTRIAVYPHFKNKLKKEVADFRKKIPYPVQTLKDSQALLISGKKIKLIV